MQRNGPAGAVMAALLLAAVAGEARDERQNAPPQSSSAVRGRVEVLDSARNIPLRRAAVTIRNDATGFALTTATDGEGQYQFENLKPGAYFMSASKAGFISASTPGDGSKPTVEVSVRNGATTTADFMMQRAAALEGRFLEDTGKPIAGIEVFAEWLSDASSALPAANVRPYSTKTDDLGRFRLHTLPPGRYRVFSRPPAPASGERIYFPGTDDPARASGVVAASGQTVENLMFVVPTAPLSQIAAEAMATQELEAMAEPPGGGKWATLSGRVTRSDSGQPVINVAVKLTTASGVLIRTVWTNGDGGYSIPRIIPGSYSVSGSADGHISASAAAGAGGRVQLRDGDKLNLDIQLMPLSAIEGRVLDEFGDPAPGVVVQVAQRATLAGESRFLVGRPLKTNGATDDRGWFRAYELPAGDYYLIAVPEPFAASGPAPFPITYFPGTTSPSAATPISITFGADAHGVTLSLPGGRSATVTGIVTDPGGQIIPRAAVFMLPLQDGDARLAVSVRADADANGAFVVRNVPEGTYLLQGRGPGAFGTATVTVTGSPSRDFSVRFVLRPLGTLRGRVTFEGGSPPPVRPANFMFVATQPTDPLQSGSAVQIGPIVNSSGQIIFPSGGVQNDWTFQLRDLAGVGILRVETNETLRSDPTNADSGWAFARALYQGRDITDTPIDFQSGDIDGVELVMTTRVGSVSGMLALPDIPSGLQVLVFGDENDSWIHAGRTRRLAAIGPTGEFKVTGLLPGRYFALAVSRVSADPMTLLPLRTYATPFTVTEGTNATVRLTTVK